MDALWIVTIILLLSGIIISTLGSMSGLGGGFLAVPYLVIFWGLNRPEAVLVSLFMIFFNSGSSTFRHARNRMINWKSAIYLVVPAVPGVIIGYFLLKELTSGVFDILFSLLLLGVTLYIFFKRRKNVLQQERRNDVGFNRVLSIPSAFVGGLLSSTFGVGGGAIFMPIQVGMLGIRIKRAIATSMFIIFIITFFRVFVISLMEIDLLYSLPLAIGALVGGQAGAVIVNKTRRSEFLLYLMIGFLAFIALYMGISGIIEVAG
jgi:uncharacterized membrane protein YfcA